MSPAFSECGGASAGRICLNLPLRCEASTTCSERRRIRIRRMRATLMWLGDFVANDFKAGQGVWAEGGADGDVDGVTATGDQNATDARRVVAGVEGVPLPAEVGFEPAGEVHRRVWGRQADVAEIAGAVPRGNVHAAA